MSTQLTEDMGIMKFGVVTPSYNQRDWLKRCIASVADQVKCGIQVHHHIQDGGSSEGTVEWLSEHISQQASITDYKITLSSEPDEGMYDALNKGLQCIEADVYAYLNCDEQYLKETLHKVASRFCNNQGIDAVFGNMLLLNADGTLSAYRKSYVLRKSYVRAAHLYVPPCTMFWRRWLLDDGVLFNTEWKARGDEDFVLHLLDHGARFEHIRGYLTGFFLTGDNLGNSLLQLKSTLMQKEAPFWIRRLTMIWNGLRYIEVTVHGVA